MKRLILRSPEMGGGNGGGQSAPASTGTGGGESGGSSSAPIQSDQSSTSSNPMERMAAHLSSLEPYKQESEEGQEEEKKEPENPWEEEEVNLLSTVGVDPKGLKKDENLQKILGKVKELSQNSAVPEKFDNLQTRYTELEQALHAGDAKMLKELGFDLPLDTRGPEDRYNEVASELDMFNQHWKGMIKELVDRIPQDQIPEGLADVIQGTYNRFKRTFEDRASVYKKEIDYNEQKERLAKDLGIGSKEPAVVQKYKQMSSTALANATDLVQQGIKSGDKDAESYLSVFDSATKPGGPLHAIGVNLAKAFGTNKNTAKFFYEIGKKVRLADSIPSIIAEQRKQWEKGEAMKAQGSGSPSGASPSSGTPSLDSAQTSSLSANLRRFMGQL